ncbi:hypothetical protein POSPLADRAFT_1051078 [Postia placenta MAD-698-R-SB12]|uniref:Uncharacterized protein n=1 Tax=Postia placenta MAD-698-R-SB12 TaxID=670580 RepID=A0A1X6NEW6_9APHY|nr:hypothetical protein POSPLADRAFT_1051078 [Postia placenta MAD-698-R-SB12]OSX66913.1 hypothetical protein POSPLADRAFT_1051078 [Postia placenta MAD-698-R-SB12]
MSSYAIIGGSRGIGLELVRQLDSYCQENGAGDRELAWKAHITTFAAYGMTKTAANTVMTKYAALLESEEFAVFALSPGYVGTTDTAVQPDETGNAALDDMLENMCNLYPAGGSL